MTYGTLGILVDAITKPMEQKIATVATKAGDDASAKINGRMSKGLARLGPVAGSIGKSVATGLGLATTAAVTFGIKAYDAAEKAAVAQRQTAAVIKSTGGVANVTQKSINTLNTALMTQTGITKGTIRSGENMLLTFRNIRNESGKNNDIFNQTTHTLLDLTSAMTGGNVTSEATRKTAIQLGKALNDPINGVSALTRVGVTFTDQQKKQITTLTQSGHRLQAQKIILKELNTEFGGSAVASATAGKRIHAAFASIQTSIGGALVKGLEPLLSDIGKLASKFGAAVSEGGRLHPIMTAIGSVAQRIAGPVKTVVDRLSSLISNIKPSQVQQIADAIKRFGPALAGVGAAAAAFTGGGLLTMLPGVAPILGQLIGPLKTILPLISGLGKEAGLASHAFSVMTGPVGIILTIFTTLMAVSPQFRQAVMQLVQALVVALMPAFKAIFAAIKPLMPIIVVLAKMLGSLLAPVILALTPLLVALTPIIAELAQVIGILLKLVLMLVMPILKVYIAFQKWVFAKILIPIINLLVTALTWLVKIIGSVIKWIMGGSPGLIPAFVALQKVVLTVINVIKNVIIAGFNAIKNAISAAWHWITTTSTSTWNAVKSVVTNAIHALTGVVSSGFNTVKSLVQHGLSAALNTVKQWGTDLFNAGKSAISSMLHGITSAMAGIGSWVKAHIVDPVVNAVKGFFHISSPSQVMANLGENVGKGFIVGLVKQNPLSVAKHIFGGIPNALGAMVTKGIVSIGALPAKALAALGKVGGFLKGALTKIGGFFGKIFGGGGSGVMQWAPIMRAVLAHFGIPQLFGTFMTQMQTESGGNPNAINLWDSNAKAGIPSQGLMQVIPPTFAAYAGPYRSRGILDPLANIYAAVAYAISRYGASIGAVLGHGHGYAAGGPIMEPITGFGHRSGQMYHFGEAGPEWVTPMGKLGRQQVVINVYPQKGQSEVEIAAAVSRQLDWATQTGRA